MRIYTRYGDTGETSLYGGQQVHKDDTRVEAYGTVDETNALLGVAATHLTDDPELRDLVIDLQRELFTVGADLATPLERDARAGKAVVPRVTPDHVTALEKLIDRYEDALTPLRQFIVPGGTSGAAALHHARTVCRRAERCVVTLHRAAPETMNAETLRYLNRLADLLFVLARAANHCAGVEDVPWTRSDAGS
jgi:cob(I)alamin adenosyltransferase